MAAVHYGEMKMKLLRLQREKVGLSPGTVLYVGEPRTHSITVSEIQYDAQSFKHLTGKEIPAPGAGKRKSWIHIDGLHDSRLLKELGEQFRIHPLALEDMANTAQRPKFEEYQSFLYFVLKWPVADGDTISLRHINIILGANYVITLQEIPGNIFTSVLQRLELRKGRIRDMEVDYLAYALMDTVVDQYFVLLDTLSERIDALQDEVLDSIDDGQLHRIHILKKNISQIRHGIWPFREMFGRVERLGQEMFAEATAPFLRDLNDHSTHILDAFEIQRELIADLHQLYMALVANKTNGVMKVLTIIATIFIPLTFLSGLYGMNFEHMPELGWRWGYFYALLLMGAVAGGLLVFFKRKGWI